MQSGSVRSTTRLFILAVAGALSTLPQPLRAQAIDRWAVEDMEAVATLPRPRGGDGVTGATLACAARRWTLTLSVAAGTALEDGTVTMAIDGKAFDLPARADGAALSAAVPTEALEPLRQGVSMRLDFSGALERAIGDLVFPLRGSRAAIDAAAARCPQRDMKGYTPVTFTPYSSYLNLARELRRDDIAAFAQATTAQPAVEAAMAEFGEGRRVLFTRLCGSSWYFGSSGCNITGFAPEAATGGGEGWRAVYDTENVHLYIDPRSVLRGWPDLATLPVGTEGLARLWTWNGSQYAHAGELPDEEPLALRPGKD